MCSASESELDSGVDRRHSEVLLPPIADLMIHNGKAQASVLAHCREAVRFFALEVFFLCSMTPSVMWCRCVYPWELGA